MSVTNRMSMTIRIVDKTLRKLIMSYIPVSRSDVCLARM